MAEERRPADEAVIALGRAVLTQVDFRRARFDLVFTAIGSDLEEVFLALA